MARYRQHQIAAVFPTQRKQTQTDPILATGFAVGLLMHVFVLFAYTTTHSATSFFEDQEVTLEVKAVRVVQVPKAVKPVPPPPPPPPEKNQKAIPKVASNSRQVSPSKPTVAAAGALRPGPQGGAPAPHTLTTRGPSGWSAPVGSGGMGNGGIGQGTGSGIGNGDGGGGGNGGAPPPPPPPPAAARNDLADRIHVVHQYSQRDFLNGRSDDLLRNPNVSSVQTWEQMAQQLNIPYSEIAAMQFVNPYLVSPCVLSARQLDIPDLKEEAIGLQVTVHADGSADAAITSSGVSQGMETLAYNAAIGCRWLPALRSGQPVEYTVNYTIRFSATD